MNKAFIFSFNALLAFSIALLAVAFFSVLLSQVHAEKSISFAKIQVSSSADQNFYSGEQPSDSLNSSQSGSGYCSALLKYPEQLDFSLGNRLTEIRRCVALNE